MYTLFIYDDNDEQTMVSTDSLKEAMHLYALNTLMGNPVSVYMGQVPMFSANFPVVS